MGKKRSRRRSRSSPLKPILWIFGSILFLGAIGGMTYYLIKKNSKSDKKDETERVVSGSAKDPPKVSPELKKVLEETDKKNPGWRLHDMWAKRPKIDSAKNGASIVVSVGNQMPKGWSGQVDFPKRQNPTQPLAFTHANAYRALLSQYATQLASTRKISIYPRGSYPLEINFQNPLQTLLPYALVTRDVVELLRQDVFVRSEDRDGPGAMQSCLAMMRVSAYFRDDWFLITQLVRIAEMTLAIGALEQALRCANVSDNDLLSVQQVLEAEGDGSALSIGLRGERATLHTMIVNVGKGEANWTEDRAGVNISDSDHAWVLRSFNEMIDLADRRVPLRADAWRNFDAELRKGPENALKIMPAVIKVHEASARVNATVRAAAIALAVERYRRAKGDWPAQLNQLVPAYMKSIPVDPFTGGAMKYARNAEGIAVYVQGPAAFDGGGAFHTIGPMNSENQGFRLLDPSRRR